MGQSDEEQFFDVGHFEASIEKEKLANCMCGKHKPYA